MSAELAITLHQPLVDAILVHGCDVIAKSYRTNVRGRIYLHAGRKLNRDLEQWMLRNGHPIREEYQRGVILGSCHIVDCVGGSDSKWFYRRKMFAWEVAFPEILPEPIPCRGEKGFFAVEIEGLGQ